ncbi:hypothetical protein V5O48_001317 [Marasmius crinis-equi]|uniref:Uncharacterized protein n=1 Tax=Marasmius crinis-equi TaxID=585013 RepID=A0ABR3FYQ8_9AGAR
MLHGGEDEDEDEEAEQPRTYDFKHAYDANLSGLCRSITIEYRKISLCWKYFTGIGFWLRKVINMIKLSNDHDPSRGQRLQLPNLRRISFKVRTSRPMEAVFYGNHSLFSCLPPFSDFPQQVTNLEVSFTHGEPEKTPCCRYERFGLGKRVTVLGTSEKVARQLVGILKRSKGVPVFKQEHIAWKEVESEEEQEDDGDGDESVEWFDAETGSEPLPNSTYSQPARNFDYNAWADYIESLFEPYSRDELERLLAALARRVRSVE